jgi:hypothetical protein
MEQEKQSAAPGRGCLGLLYKGKVPCDLSADGSFSACKHVLGYLVRPYQLVL